MSCSSWTNSISMPGAASCSLSRRSSMTSSAARRVAARLQAHEDVALVLLRGEQPQLRSGAPRVGRDVRRASSTASIFRSARSVSSSAVPGGRQVVDDEAALVGLRQEPGAERA